MSGFSAEWLALREPVDAASRNGELTTQLLNWRQQFNTLSVLDLASGTGANARFLAPMLGGEQHWRLIDHDPKLLAQSARLPLTACWRIERHCLDLVSAKESLDFQNIHLVTASALIDLVSAEWLEWLAQHCRKAQAAIFIALSYDGLFVWDPALKDDERVRAWVNRHQQTNKGFGPALGPLAAPEFKTMLERLNYRAELRPSPWQLGPEQIAMQTALLKGWVEAAREIAPGSTHWLNEWAAQRRSLIEQQDSRLTVGHWDLFAQP